MKVVKRAQAHYEVQAVEFGRVYKWHPERIVGECQCGQTLSLTASMTTSCVECGSEHVLDGVKEISMDGRQSDETLHPWRYYSEDHDEDAGLPF